MNLRLTEAEVVAHCEKAGVAISAIETLPAGGTHLVTVTSDGAAIMLRVLAKHLIQGRVQRFGYMSSPQSIRREEARAPARAADTKPSLFGRTPRG